MRGVVILSAIVLILCLSRFASACTTNSECTIGTPYCNQTSLCVACLVNAHCRASEYCTNQGTCATRPACGQCTSFTNAPVCSSSKCVQCTTNNQCASGVCDTTVKVCRPPTSCANATVCAGTDRPICNSGACVECLSNSDCSTAFPICTAAGVCTAQTLQPILMCSTDAGSGKRTLFTSISAESNVNVVYPVGSRNALFVVGSENVLLNAEEQFTLNNIPRFYYPQFFEQLNITADATVTWYLDGYISTLTLNSSTDCPANVSFFVSVTDLTYVTANGQNVSDTIANVLGVDTSRVTVDPNVNKRSVQQSPGNFQVTIADGMNEVSAVLVDSSQLTAALTDLGLTVNSIQGAALFGLEPIPVPDGNAAPYTAPTAVGAPVAGSPSASPVDAPAAGPTSAVPITPIATFPPSSTPLSDGVVATPGALDSGIIVAIVVVCVVVGAAVIIIAVVVSRNKKKKSGGGGSSSRMERGSATELKETGTAASVMTSNPTKKVESESSDEDEESGEDVDSSDEDEESQEEESGSEVSSGSGSNEGSSSAEGSGSNEGSNSGSEESS
eukprot:TRINITY_DN1480_c0_g4_i1.p1 TRINITY_DN1480_c0_g4~~TRINITY_DN1480_c0_g4_i1.p1  ORF type:complete len:559 (-),score=100.36 TRINITY_DN1480_c0_g4_i1:58-1734(-)